MKIDFLGILRNVAGKINHSIVKIIVSYKVHQFVGIKFARLQYITLTLTGWAVPKMYFSLHYGRVLRY